MRRLAVLALVLIFGWMAEPCRIEENISNPAIQQDGEKKIQLCWEDLELYEDEEFTVPLSEDDDYAKAFKKKRPKYEKTVKEEASKIVGQYGGELVECPNHTLKGSGLAQVGKEVNPYHFKIKLTYGGALVITIYAKVEVYKDGRLVAEFKDERSMNIFRAADRAKRKKSIIGFGNKLVRKMTEKIKEHESKK